MKIKLSNNKYLEVLEIEKNAPVKNVRVATNRIVIVDRSGSMWGILDKVIDDVSAQVQHFSDEDTLSFGWFSSEGQFGWACKGLQVGPNRDKIPTILNKYKETVGMTCFYQILDDVNQVVSDLTPISSVFTLLFLSDGYSNQGTNKVLKSLKSIASKLSRSLFVGYGDWYERKLMGDMAECAGGVLVHASKLAEFSNFNADFAKSDTKPKMGVSVDLSDVNSTIYVLDNDTLTTVDKENPYVNQTAESLIFTVDSSTSETYRGDEIRILYLLARQYLQAGKYTDALDVLGVIGDVNFIDKVNSAFTVAEYGNVENLLLEAAKNIKARFISGRKENYVPKEDAFCILDLMDTLTVDPTAEFLPYHPDFQYKRIGRPSKTEEGYPKFNAAKTVGCKTNTLVWNSSQLNIGVLAKIEGTVDLDENAKSLGLDRQFKTFIWRNYLLVFDGKLNVTNIPLRNLSDLTKKTLLNNNIVSAEDLKSDVITIDLTNIPMINRNIARSNTSLTDLCRNVKTELQVEAENKVISHFYKLIPEDVRESIENILKPTEFSPVQVEYLEKFGVKKDGCFDPPSTLAESTDKLDVNEFEVYVDGIKSLPKVADVLKKIEDGKTKAVKFTPSQAIMVDPITKVTTETLNYSQNQQALWLKETLEDNRKQLRELRRKMNRTKFAVILGKTNFDELPVLTEKNEFDFDDLTFIVSKRVVEKKI